MESITPVGKRPDPLAEAGRPGAFPGSLKRIDPAHAAVPTALVLEPGDVPWLLNRSWTRLKQTVVLEPGDVPWLLNGAAKEQPGCAFWNRMMCQGC